MVIDSPPATRLSSSPNRALASQAEIEGMGKPYRLVEERSIHVDLKARNSHRTPARQGDSDGSLRHASQAPVVPTRLPGEVCPISRSCAARYPPAMAFPSGPSGRPGEALSQAPSPSTRHAAASPPPAAPPPGPPPIAPPPPLPSFGSTASPAHPGASDPIDALHAVSDTIAGPNLRWKDNAVQAVAILGCAGLGALIGWLNAPSSSIAFGVLAGTIVGLVVGLLASGFVLGIYRLATRVGRPR